jgi:DNA-binding transcriptional regulator YhcF (GntR family)
VEPPELPPAGTLPSHIYESNAGNLGILSSDEVTNTVEYYSSLLTQKAIIESIRTDGEAITPDQKELHDNMPKLEDDRTELIETLKN